MGFACGSADTGEVTGAGFPETQNGALPNDGKGFSAIPMVPDVVRELKANGKPVPAPFPKGAKKGKPFNPQGTPITPLSTASEQKVLVIFADFTTPPPGGPATRLGMKYFDDMLFGTTYDPPEYAPYAAANYPKDRTLVNYYKEVSYGKVDVVTLNMPSALGWTNVGKPYDYYCKGDGVHDNGFGAYPQNVQGVVIDLIKAVKAAHPELNFANYAVNGKIPNLFVVHSGTGAEWSGATDIIWSHSWDLTEGTGFNGYRVDGVIVNNYAMMPEVGNDTTGFRGTAGAPYPPTVGVYAHEYGHVLGLPDQYDYGYESNGTGEYSLMAGGSWNLYPLYRIFLSNSPAHMDAWSKFRVGFATPIEVTGPMSAVFAPAEMTPAIYKMPVPGANGLEYYLLENRQLVGFDQGLVYTYSSAHPGVVAHGLAIYHVDESVFNRNYWFPNEAENWKEQRFDGWKKASNGETHYGISLIQADDEWGLERGAYGDPGDLYPGVHNVTSFGTNTFPNSSSYYFYAASAPHFGYSGATVDNIVESNGMVSANLYYAN
jgi:M6 family metalloprotease-like protein